LGIIADKIGIKTVFLSGLLLFVIVYLLFGMSGSTILILLAFFLYGIYAAATEGISKAWITNLTHNQNTATAVGFYTSCQSICSLLASAIAGLLWSTFNSSVAFFTTSVITLLVIMFFMLAFKGQLKTT
jgi:MFS family permease